MHEEQLVSAVDLVLGVNALGSVRRKVKAEIEDCILRFVADEALEESIPSVGEAITQMHALCSACEAMKEQYPSGDRGLIGARFQQALDPFLGADPLQAIGMLDGCARELCETELGRDTQLRRALNRISSEEPLEPGENFFIEELGAAARHGAEMTEKLRGTGKGKGGAPLHPKWARHDLVVALLDIWERHSPGRATRGPGAKFVSFVSVAFEAATGEPAGEHGRVIRTVIRKWRARERIPTPGRPSKGGSI